jgi:hypothetical protein
MVALCAKSSAKSSPSVLDSLHYMRRKETVGGRQGECLHDFRNVSPVSLDGAFGHRTWACAMSTQIDGDCLVAR